MGLRSKENPATRNRTRDHLITAEIYSQMLYQLSYSRDNAGRPQQNDWQVAVEKGNRVQTLVHPAS